jgi:hypothetical protein
MRYPRYPDQMAKVLVSFDDALLRRIDRIAKARGLTRSGYLAELAARDVDSAKGPGASPSAQRAIKRLRELFAENPHPGDSTQWIREMRDSR